MVPHVTHPEGLRPDFETMSLTPMYRMFRIAKLEESMRVDCLCLYKERCGYKKGICPNLILLLFERVQVAIDLLPDTL